MPGGAEGPPIPAELDRALMRDLSPWIEGRGTPGWHAIRAAIDAAYRHGAKEAGAVEEHESLGALGSNTDLTERDLEVWLRAQNASRPQRLGRLDELAQRRVGDPRSAVVSWPARDPDETTIHQGKTIVIGPRRGQVWSAVHVFVPVERPKVGRCGEWVEHEPHQLGQDPSIPEGEQLWVCLGVPEDDAEANRKCREHLEELPPGLQVFANGIPAHLTIPARRTGHGDDWAVTVQTDDVGALEDLTISRLRMGTQTLRVPLVLPVLGGYREHDPAG